LVRWVRCRLVVCLCNALRVLYGCIEGHDGQMWISCVSARSLICVSVGRSFLCATRKCARYWDLAAAVVGGVIGSLQ
jgi:hypothetical protein